MPEIRNMLPDYPCRHLVRMGAPQLSWPTGLLTRVVLHGSWAWEEIQKMSREWDQQRLNLPAMKCSNRKPGQETHHLPCQQILPHVFWKSWLVSWLLAPLCFSHICLSSVRQIRATHTCCTCICVSREGPVWKLLAFQTALLVTWLMRGHEHRFFQTAAAHRKAAACGLQGDSQASYLGNAPSLSSGLMTWGSVLLRRTLQVSKGNLTARSFSVGFFPVSETENFYHL